MKRKILLISLGMLLGSLITVGATILIQSNQVLYKNDKTVEEALNDLYTKSNIGNATASDIRSGKTALVGGQEVTGSLTVPSYTNLSGTQSVGAGSSSALLNGYYNLSNYKVQCGSNSCSACNSCCPTCSGRKYYETTFTPSNGTVSSSRHVTTFNLSFSPSKVFVYLTGEGGYSRSYIADSRGVYSVQGYTDGTTSVSTDIISVSGSTIKFSSATSYFSRNKVHTLVAVE